MVESARSGRRRPLSQARFKNSLIARGEHGIAGIDGVLGIADQVGKAELVCVGVIALRNKAIGDPHVRPRPAKELVRHDLAARGRNHVGHGLRGDEGPLQCVLPLTRAEVSSLAITGLLRTEADQSQRVAGRVLVRPIQPERSPHCGRNNYPRNCSW
jgi:hypothetical protein